MNLRQQMWVEASRDARNLAAIRYLEYVRDRARESAQKELEARQIDLEWSRLQKANETAKLMKLEAEIRGSYWNGADSIFSGMVLEGTTGTEDSI